MFSQNVRHRTGAGNSPIPNRSLHGARTSQYGIANASPHPTHMSNHPPVTPFPPFRSQPFGGGASMSPSPFTSPFARLATPFKNHYRRIRGYSGAAHQAGNPYSSQPTYQHLSEEQMDLQAAMVVYACGLILGLFLFWFSSTMQSRFIAFWFWLAGVMIFLGAIAGIVSDVWTWWLVPKMQEVQDYIRSFKLSALFPFLMAPQAPVGTMNTPPRRRGGVPSHLQQQHRHHQQPHGGVRRSPTKIGAVSTGQDGGQASNRHDAFLRPGAGENFYSPNRARDDVIIKDPYGHRTAATAAEQPSVQTSGSSGFLGTMNAFLFGDSPAPVSSGPQPSNGHHHHHRPSTHAHLHPNVTTGRGQTASGGGIGDPRPQGTPIGSAFANVNFSPIPPAKPTNMISPYGTTGRRGVAGTGASKLFSPMSLDSRRVDTSIQTNFSFLGIGHTDHLDSHQQKYAASAPLSPRQRHQENMGFGTRYSQSLNTTSYPYGGQRENLGGGSSAYGDQSRGVLQPTSRTQNEMTTSSRFGGGGGLTQRYGQSYRHAAQEQKKRASLEEHVESSVELYRALNIDDKIHNWAEKMRWWLMQQVIKPRTQDWEVNDMNVNELFNWVYEKFENSRAELSRFQTAAKRGEFFLANMQQMSQMSQNLKEPQILEIIQKRQHIVTIMKKIAGSSRHLEYLQKRLRFLSNCTNPSEIKWNGGGKEWESGVLPTDSQLMMSMFGHFMDDYLCPSVEFTGKYLIKCDVFPHEDEMDEMVRKHCRGGFEDVGIVEVGHHTFGADVMGPYYFVIFDKIKYRELDERVLLKQRQHQEMRRSYHSSRASRRRASSSAKYAAWYPQPGGSNMIHALTLFGFFVHENMEDTIANRNMLGQEMFVECFRGR